MEGLRALISKVKFSQDQCDLESHKSIYDYVLSEFPSTRTVPPLDVTIYALRNMLYPSFLQADISYLLDLLSIIERYRLRVVELARDASVWNEYYKSSIDNVNETLNRDEEKIVKRLMQETRADAQRKIYRMIILQCCHLDIYHLWNGQYPCIPVRLNEYFSRKVQKPKLFRRDLSDAEQEDLCVMGQTCQKFWQDALAWLAERVKTFQAQGLSEDDALDDGELYSHKRDFTTAFPIPVEETTLMESIEWYLKKVQSDVNALENIFPT